MAVSRETASKCLASLKILYVLNDNNNKRTRGKSREWIRGRKQKGYYTNIVKELRVEDKVLLNHIKEDITPHQRG